MSVSRSWRSASFMRRFGRLDAGAQVLRVLQRRVVARLLRLQRRCRASSSVCCGTSVRLNSSAARARRPACACSSSALAFCTSGVFSISAAGARGSGAPILRQRPRQRRLLLVEVVLLLLASSSNQHLAGRHAIAEVREDAADLAFGFRRDRDLVDGGERADDFDRSFDRVAADFLDAHRSGSDVLGTGLRLGFGAACGDGEEGGKPGQAEDGRHRGYRFARRRSDYGRLWDWTGRV